MLTPFEIEGMRDELATKTKFVKFRKTYTKRFPEIKDINTPSFWNGLIEKGEIRKSPFYKDKIKRICEFLKNKEGKLLDVGFGYGDIEGKLLEGGSRLEFFGVDISKVAVKNARKELRGDYEVGSILKLVFEKSFFDVVLALDVLEHIPPSRTFEALAEVGRVLKRHGIFVVSVPLNEDLEKMINQGTNPNGHIRVYTPNILKAELNLEGFEVSKEEYLYAFEKSYPLKSVLINFLPKTFRKPNLLIIFAKKS